MTGADVFPGMSFVPIGRGPPTQGVYFLNFSAHFKRSLRLAREQAAEVAKKRADSVLKDDGSRRSSPRQRRGKTPSPVGAEEVRWNANQVIAGDNQLK